MTKEEAKLVLDNARPQTKEIDRQFYDDEDLNNALDMAIKALEQQTSGNEIQKEKSLAFLDGCIAGVDASNKIVFHYLEKRIQSMPPVTPTHSWIPVSERLPDTDDEVLCWYEYYHFSKEKVLPEYGIGFYYKETETWCGEVASGFKARVIAWQPLPKPYEEKRGSENEVN